MIEPKIELWQILLVLFIVDLLLITPEDFIPIVGMIDELFLLAGTGWAFMSAQRRRK